MDSRSAEGNSDPPKNLKSYLKFAQRVCRKLYANIWEEDLGLYLLEASFTHKMNPFDQARTSRAMIYRKPG